MTSSASTPVPRTHPDMTQGQGPQSSSELSPFKPVPDQSAAALSRVVIPPPKPDHKTSTALGRILVSLGCDHKYKEEGQPCIPRPPADGSLPLAE